MILLSPDAVLDVERIRNFLEGRNSDATQRALAVTDPRRQRKRLPRQFDRSSLQAPLDCARPFDLA